MNCHLVIQVVATVILKLIASCLFLTYVPQIFYIPVLQDEPSAIRKDCPAGWHSFKGKCYFFSTKAETWDESQKTCVQFSSNLAVVNSQEELAFLKLRTMFENYFIGLTKKDGSWTWIDNTTFDLNISDGNQRRSQCVMVGFRSVDSTSCSVPYRYICEKNA